MLDQIEDEPKLNPPGAVCFRLRAPSSGVLTDLAFEIVRSDPPGPGEILIGVRATGLNFRDVLSALGKYPGAPGPLGREEPMSGSWPSDRSNA